MRNTAPYFAFYPDDWLNSERIFEMGLEAEGAYIRLLAAMWKNGGSIKDDPVWICNILRCKPAKWKKIRSILVDETGVICIQQGRVFNEKLTEIYRKFVEKSEKNSKNAKERWENEVKNDTENPNEINKTIDAFAMRSECHTDTDTDRNANAERSVSAGDLENIDTLQGASDLYIGDKQKKIRKKFIKPTLDEIREYCNQRKNNVMPEAFMDHYESNGWRVGKNPMKDWHAAIRTWERQTHPPHDKPKKSYLSAPKRVDAAYAKINAEKENADRERNPIDLEKNDDGIWSPVDIRIRRN